jgi:hypothetical protein
MPLRITIPQGTGTSVGSGVTTYDGLVATVESWLNRPDLSPFIPDFITLLEAELNRVIRHPDMENVFSFSTVADNPLPSDFLELISLYLDVDPRAYLEPISLESMDQDYADQTVGQPQAFVISNGNITLGPAPDDSYSAVLTYFRKIPALSSSNQTNWLIVSHPDIYLFGTLALAEAFIWDDPRIPLWRSGFDKGIDQLNTLHGARKRYGSAPLRIRPTVVE